MGKQPAKNLGVKGWPAYALALALAAMALGLRLLMDPLLGDRLPFGMFFVAAVVASQFLDVRPMVVAILAGLILGDWFFLQPRHSFLITGALNQSCAALYLCLSCGVVSLSWRMRRALAQERSARVAMEQLAAIIESSGDAIIGQTLDGKITSWNAGAQKLYGYTQDETVGLPNPFLNDELKPLLERAAQGENISHFETVRRRKDGALVEVSLTVSPVRNGAGAIIGASTIARCIQERKKAERERERLVAKLQKALSEVKTLSGLFPICAYCKKIRDDKGYWNQIELYIRDHSSASFTHSICPDCSRDNYPDYHPEPHQDPAAKK